ncbi:FixH family protein [bacterium]|nr:FixH family protein [bacterium]
MREWIRERPWIWIVLLLTFFVIMDIIFVVIAVKNHPTLVN